MKVVTELFEIAHHIEAINEKSEIGINSTTKGYYMTSFETLQIAAMVQRNRMFQTANVIDTLQDAPSALEKIGMEISYIAAVIKDNNSECVCEQ